MTDADRGQLATDAAEVYEQFFLPAVFDQWPGRILERAGTGPGNRVLDVGCGTGILARTALQRVMPGGTVTGVDPNPGMLGVARRTPGIEWRQGAAEDLPFADGAFDTVVSQFALMFFDDRARAVTEMRRVLVGGGCVAVATWADLDRTPGYAAMVDLLDDLFGSDAGDALRAPYNLGDPDLLKSLFDAEFENVVVDLVDGTARFDSIEAWVHTDIRGWTLSTMSDDDYERLLGAARTELARFVADDGVVTFPAPAVVGVAR